MRASKHVSVWVAGWIMTLFSWGCAGQERYLSDLSTPPSPSGPAPQQKLEPQAAPELPLPPLPPPPVLPTAAREGMPETAPASVSPEAVPVVPAPVPAPQTPVDTGVPAPPTLDLDGLAKLRSLQRLAAERFAGMDSYLVRLRRREQVNGKDKPEEILLFKFRKQPWSVFFKWLGPEGNGREVVYVKGQYDDKIHTLLAAGDVPLLPAGRRLALAPENPLVRSSSRRSITEAGFGALLDRLQTALTALEQGDSRAGTFQCLGALKRPEFDSAGQAVEQTLFPGGEALLPRGGRRLWFFDAVNNLPMLIITQDETGHEVEYYCYDRLQFPVKLDEDDFNPDKLWNPDRGKDNPISRPPALR